jgi:hypothetical protein
MGGVAKDGHRVTYLLSSAAVDALTLETNMMRISKANKILKKEGGTGTYTRVLNLD